MAISIDTVYQQVLAIANKEQRGYITPQVFNLLAYRAQLQIFEEYFVDIKKAYLRPGNSSEASDELEMLNERISIFRQESDLGRTGNAEYSIGLLHRLLNVYYQEDGSDLLKEVTEVDSRRFLTINAHPLSAPTENHSVYYRLNAQTLKVAPNIPEDASLFIQSIRKPTDPEWGYVVIQEKALYNPHTSFDFELHPAEEQNLVNRILELAGIAIKKPDLTSVAGGLIQRDKIEENN